MTYLIEAGNTENTFSMHSDGRLYLSARPAEDQYQLRVRVIDSGEVPKFTTAIINIYVNDTGCIAIDTTIQ